MTTKATIKTQESARDALEDPFSKSTRSAKRVMLVFSCITLLIIKTGVSIDEFSVLGLKFPGLTVSNLYNGLLIILVYSILVFFASGLADCYKHRRKRDIYNINWASEDYNQDNPNSSEAQEQSHWEEDFKRHTGYKPLKIPHPAIIGLIFCRLAIEFLIPLVFGILCLGLFFWLRVLG